MRLLYASALIAFALDQLSKWLIVWQMDLITKRVIEVAPPYLTFIMGWNTGINFGLFAGSPGAVRWVLIGVAVAASLFVIVWGRRNFHRPVEFLSGGLIVGGALANGLDRLLYGAVADFLNMSCCGIDNPYTFNVADIFIFAGAFGLILFSREKGA